VERRLEVVAELSLDDQPVVPVRHVFEDYTRWRLLGPIAAQSPG
jgi:hypothetical protein